MNGKIAYLVSDFQAPSHTFVRREVQALRDSGIEIEPFSIQGSANNDPARAILGQSPLRYLGALLAAFFGSPVRLFSTWWLALKHRAPGTRALLWSQFHFVEAVLLARLIGKHEVVHLHNHFANSGATVGLLAAHLANIPWSLTLHGISETDYPAGATLPEKLERATFIACASRFMMAQGMRTVDRSHWSKFELVRCGVDRESLPVTPSKDPGPAIRVVCVGRLSAEKGYFGLFQALQHPDLAQASYELRIVGDGPLSDEIQASAAAAGIGDRVEFLGALPESETLAEIATSDLLVLPSLMEGLPVVIIEALALGKPVVASGVAGIPEIMRNGINGYMVEPGHWDQLGEHLADLLANPEKLRELGAQAGATFDEQFDIRHAVKPLHARFSKSLSKATTR